MKCHRSTCSFLCFFVVGEEDELSIKEAAELVVEGMQFTGKLEVSFVNWISGGRMTCVPKLSFKRRSSIYWQATVVTYSNNEHF